MPVGLRFRLGSWLWRLKMVTKIPDKKSGQGSVPSWANPGVRTPSLSARLWVDDVCFSKGGICDPVRNCFPQKMALWRHGCSWVSLGVTLQRWDMCFFRKLRVSLPMGEKHSIWNHHPLGSTKQVGLLARYDNILWRGFLKNSRNKLNSILPPLGVYISPPLKTPKAPWKKSQLLKNPKIYPIRSRYGIFTYICLMFVVNEGKYTSSMDPVGIGFITSPPNPKRRSETWVFSHQLRMWKHPVMLPPMAP